MDYRCRWLPQPLWGVSSFPPSSENTNHAALCLPVSHFYSVFPVAFWKPWPLFAAVFMALWELTCSEINSLGQCNPETSSMQLSIHAGTYPARSHHGLARDNIIFKKKKKKGIFFIKKTCDITTTTIKHNIWVIIHSVLQQHLMINYPKMTIRLIRTPCFQPPAKMLCFSFMQKLISREWMNEWMNDSLLSLCKKSTMKLCLASLNEAKQSCVF